MGCKINMCFRVGGRWWRAECGSGGAFERGTRTGSHCTVRLGHSSACVITKSAQQHHCSARAPGADGVRRGAARRVRTVEEGRILLPDLVLLIDHALLLVGHAILIIARHGARCTRAERTRRARGRCASCGLYLFRLSAVYRAHARVRLRRRSDNARCISCALNSWSWWRGRGAMRAGAEGLRFEAGRGLSRTRPSHWPARARARCLTRAARTLPNVRDGMRHAAETAREFVRSTSDLVTPVRAALHFVPAFARAAAQDVRKTASTCGQAAGAWRGAQRGGLRFRERDRLLASLACAAAHRVRCDTRARCSELSGAVCIACMRQMRGCAHTGRASPLFVVLLTRRNTAHARHTSSC